MLQSAHGDDVAGEWVFMTWDILREFLGHNFASGLRTLKPKKLKMYKKTFFLKT